MTPQHVVCPYCGRDAEFLASSREIYNGREYGPLYICRPCDARVGCHADTTKPLGRLANAELRALKRAVHTALDPLWLRYMEAYPDATRENLGMRRIQRSRVYAWLAHQLGIPAEEAHIGMFDPERCRAALAAFEREWPTPAAIREWAKAREVA